jgi:hypothetical protein
LPCLEEFFPQPRRLGEKLERVMQRLTDDLREMLLELGKAYRHDELARWTFAPELDVCRLDVELLLRQRTHRLRLLFVTFDSLGHRLAFSPAVPEAWFELARGETLADRAAAGAGGAVVQRGQVVAGPPDRTGRRGGAGHRGAGAGDATTGGPECMTDDTRLSTITPWAQGSKPDAQARKPSSWCSDRLILVDGPTWGMVLCPRWRFGLLPFVCFVCFVVAPLFTSP